MTSNKIPPMVRAIGILLNPNRDQILEALKAIEQECLDRGIETNGKTVGQLKKELEKARKRPE